MTVIMERCGCMVDRGIPHRCDQHNDREAVRAQRDELLAALKALADRVDATSECDHKRISCEDIGCIGAEVRRARVAIAKVERK